MRLILWQLALAALTATTTVLGASQHTPRRPVKRQYDTHNYYVVEHDDRTGASIADVAARLGAEVVEPLGELDDMWVVRSPKPTRDLEARGFDPVLDAYQSLKRDVADLDGGLAARSDEEVEFSKRLYDSITYLERQELETREKRAPPPVKPPPKADALKKQFGIEDPLFPLQWHLVNDEYPEHMMNVSGLWAEGLTGKGVLTGLIDDGLDYTSEDLAPNFDAKNSYDFNDHEALPTPKKERDHHGTRCAGQIAAVKNKVCGIGIAHESKVSGIRILSGRITTADEAIALNYGFQDVSLYSCSWGPRDDGTKMQAPSYIIRKAVLNGINKGRGGKGSVFVFASGNGGHRGDQCNFDGYTNSIYSVTVSSVDWKGYHPKYSEACAANMIVAYSSGSGNHIVTTDRGKNNCATTHGGTSAAAPNAVGVFALALQARPDLTWRDIQHLCVETARQINPHDSDWDKVANGKYYSNKYGFGVLDGWAYVQAAKTWKLVKPQAWIETETIQLNNGTMDETKDYDGGIFIDGGGVESTMEITKEMLTSHNFEKLEHINVRVWIDHSRRGDVEVELVSPHGIVSSLASARDRDEATTGYPGWVFMTVKHWGEDPIGTWKIKVSDQELEDHSGFFLGWNMILWGSSIDPSKTTLYSIDKNDYVLPPPSSASHPTRPSLPGSHTTQDSKPSDTHTTLEGKPTADLPHDSTTPPAPSWLSDLTGAKQNWLLGVVGVIILLNIGAAIYYCRRHFGLFGPDAAAYNALPGAETLPLANMAGTAAGGAGGGAAMGRRLYDVVEEDEGMDADAMVKRGMESSAPTGARTGGPAAPGRSTGGIGFHSGFLDDDDPLTAAPTAGMATGRYRDDVETPTRAVSGAAGAGASSSSAEPLVTLGVAGVAGVAAGVAAGKMKEEESSEEEEDDDDEEEEETSSSETNLWEDARAK